MLAKTIPTPKGNMNVWGWLEFGLSFFHLCWCEVRCTRRWSGNTRPTKKWRCHSPEQWHWFGGSLGTFGGRDCLRKFQSFQGVNTPVTMFDVLTCRHSQQCVNLIQFVDLHLSSFLGSRRLLDDTVSLWSCNSSLITMQSGSSAKSWPALPKFFCDCDLKWLKLW